MIVVLIGLLVLGVDLTLHKTLRNRSFRIKAERLVVCALIERAQMVLSVL